MLLFNGEALEDIAPVKIVDIVVSPISMAVTSVDRAVRAGADFVRIRGKTRTVTVTFALLEQNQPARALYMQAIRRWAASTKPGKLLLPDRVGQYLSCICTTFPQLSVREWWEVGQMVFTAYDPFFTQTNENSSPCGMAFLVQGSQAPHMEIRSTLTAAIQNPSWTWNGAQTISLAGAIGPGTLVIDLEQQTITLNNASIMDAYVFPASTFFSPQLGYNNITGSGRVYWRERWE